MYHLNLSQEHNEVLSNILNPEEAQELKLQIDALGVTNHYALFSSGTSGGPMKGYLLSREALLKKAAAVNQRLGLGENDKWGASLPAYHIGGLAIYFRAELLGHTPVNLRPWNPAFTTAQIQRENVTVISLVPAQLYDLVSEELKCPACLKAVLIGGDFLSQKLESEARRLGWPLVKTFGMSEVGSQLCTGEDSEGYLRPLPIHEIKADELGQLKIKSESLFSFLITRQERSWSFKPASELQDPEGFLPLPDRVEIKKGHLLHLGRLDESKKLSGHLVNLRSIKEVMEKLTVEEKLWGEMEVKLEAHPRSGQRLILHHTSKVPEKLIRQFTELISPVKIDQIIHQSRIARTELGKFKLKE